MWGKISPEPKGDKETKKDVTKDHKDVADAPKPKSLTPDIERSI